MIIAALASYYEQLLREHPDKVARPGWVSCQVKYLLVLSVDGDLLGVIPAEGKRGCTEQVPEQVKRTSGVAANFLCDTSSYLLGIDAKGKQERSLMCFEAARARHHEILDGVNCAAARAILAFFDQWDPVSAASCPQLAEDLEGICAGGNLTFAVQGPGDSLAKVLQDDAIRRAWDARYCDAPGEGSPMVCLVTGERATPAQLHPSIKGVYGAQSTGASLISFNAPAFESYGHDGEQGRNAPVGARTAQAYGAALNYLLADPAHHLRLGDTTVVFWSEHADEANSDLFALLLGGMPAASAGKAAVDTDAVVGAVLGRMAQGKDADLEGIDLDATFYVLGVAPNAARLAVRFFLQGTFGGMLSNIRAHYRRISVVHAPYERGYLSPYWLLKATENDNAKAPVVSSELSAPLLHAILEGGRYPEALYANALLRVRANRDVSYGQAAIIRGYLIRNCGRSEDNVTAGLNAGRSDVAYALGRGFALLAWIQEEANGKDTLTGRYLDSACATPAVVFPSLLKLASAHLQKVAREKPGLAAFFDKNLSDILAEGSVDTFPRRLSQVDQGDFMLGFYHQKARRYQKADDTPAVANTAAAEEA